MGGIRKKAAVFFLAAAVSAGQFCAPAMARTAYVERNDTGSIENVTMALQSAMQIYQKYVLSNLAGLKTITGLADLQENFAALNDVRDEMGGMFGKLNISDMIKFDDLTKDMGTDFDGILSEIGSGRESIMGSIGNMFGFGGGEGIGINGAIMTGKLGNTNLAGGGRDLARTAKDKGLGGAAVEAVSRTAQTMDEIAKNASAGTDAGNAVVSGYSYLLKAVPMIHPDIAAAAGNAGKEGLNAYTDEDIEYFYTFFADASKSIPLASIMELLDRHMKEDSPYSDKKYSEEIGEDIKKIAKELENIPPAGIIDLESPETKTTRLMGVVVRQNELTLRQYETLAVLCADNIKMSSISAGLKTSKMSGHITKNIISRVTQYGLADKKAKRNALSSIGVELEGN